jgi:hypothetical protein
VDAVERVLDLGLLGVVLGDVRPQLAGADLALLGVLLEFPHVVDQEPHEVPDDAEQPGEDAGRQPEERRF